MNIIIFLIVFPFAAALLLLLIKNNVIRGIIIILSSLIICGISVYLIAVHFPQEMVLFKFDYPIADKIIFFLEILISIFLIIISIKHKKYFVMAVSLIQGIFMMFFEIYYGHKIHVANNLFIDKLSIIMALLVGVVGSLICIYSIGYMNDFHKHYRNEVKDRRRFFYFVIFMFFSSMYGIIFSNNLLWIYFFWEITTLASFFLIGYKKNEESVNNAFRALLFNLIGGLAFAAGICYLFITSKTVELDRMMAIGKPLVMLPAVLICIAGIAKSAQFPFSRWLLGAMVAPSPVSALLHSSTMVKAGVYILLRMSIVLQDSLSGFLIAILGAVTFVLTAFAAIAQNDAKKVLAYSTISNLGLVVICAGLGTYEAIWAGILLMIFHAVSKCLLFLCIGIVEHKIHSRDIEDMSGLIVTMPKTSIFIQIGIAGMFLAPFGMLISKWAVLKALIDFNPILTVFIIFGSAATLFFWVKWLGKLLIVLNPPAKLETGISKTIWFPLAALAFLTVLVCVAFPVISSYLIEPYLINCYGHVVKMAPGNILIMLIILGMVLLFPLSFFNYGKKVKVVDPYMGGANAESPVNFTGSFGKSVHIEMRNYYFQNILNSRVIFIIGIVISVLLIISSIGVTFL